MNVRVFATSRYEKQVRRLLAGPGGASRGPRYRRRPKGQLGSAGSGQERRCAVICYYSRTTEEITMQVLDPEVTPADRKAARKFVEGLKHAKKQADK